MEPFKRPPVTPLALTLRRARVAKNLTMAEVAREIGASYASFAAWEAGKNEPQATMYARWCAYLGVDPLIAARVA